MNRDKLIELATKAFHDPTKVPAFQNDFWTITTDELNAFADAIIEECAKACGMIPIEQVDAAVSGSGGNV